MLRKKRIYINNLNKLFDISQISMLCEELAVKNSIQSQKKDLSTSHVKIHEALVNEVLTTMTFP